MNHRSDSLALATEPSPDFSFQQTNSTLLLFDLSTNQAGAYRVVVSNSAGGTPSEPAILTVTPLSGLWPRRSI